jgi:hypothetical protein
MAAPLEAAIRWSLYRTSNTTSSQQSVDQGQLLLRDVMNSTTPSPFIIMDTTNVLIGIDDSWELVWTMMHSNCTWFGNGATSVLGIEYNRQQTTVSFNTSQSAQQQSSLDTALNVDTCRVADYFAYNVTGYNDLPSDSNASPLPSCAVTGPVPTGTSTCTIGTSAKDRAKQSFSASLAYSACLATSTPTGGHTRTAMCDISKTVQNSGASAAGQDGALVLSWAVVAIIGLVTCML